MKLTSSGDILLENWRLSSICMSCNHDESTEVPMLNCVLIAVTEHPCFTDSLQVYAVWYLMLFKEEDQIQYA